MTMLAKVGIVVPTLNRIRKLKRLARCLSRQTFKDFHVYIVDSGSNDGTREEIFSFPIPCTFVNATLDDWWSAATNLGIKKALDDKCELILTINDDAIVMDNYLEKFVDLFEKNNLEICGNRIDYSNNPGQVWALGSYSTFGSPFLFQLKYNDYWFNELPEEIQQSNIIPAMTLCGDGVLIKNNVFEKIGFFDQKNTPQAHGDSEFTLRAHQHGIQVHVAPHIVLYNDVDNLSETSPHTRKRSFKGKFKDVFFSIKSDSYWKPVFFICRKYTKGKFIFSTIIRFFLYRSFLYFFNDIAKFFPSSDKTNPNSSLLKKILAKWSRNFLKKTAFWVFDLNKYDEETLDHLIHNKRQKKVIDNIKKMIEFY